MSDFMLILSLLYCWPVSGYASVLVCAGNNKKIGHMGSKNYCKILYTTYYKQPLCGIETMYI